ncbi:class I SAM-dependent methyltransferase [Azospirillum sp. B506]|uniref:class I SAM-dependent methyltransferase n=1 Tax=Azospirillum sp. B506 TaxID=137721 RepID=UPI0005B272BC|nr:methyltransferase domain-containing protein [Azospirillum sp. B506]
MPDAAPALQNVVEHFTARAGRYDGSSHWCNDPALMERVLALAAPTAGDRVLDVACGTGLVSKAFRPLAGEIVGVDITPAMASQAAPFLDSFVLAQAEDLPFEDGEFDITVCRQGIQFMDAAPAACEMVRVTRKGGRVLLVNLCAYGEEDREEYFEILRLRNPVRRNFFLPDDLSGLLRAAGCREVQAHNHVSEEDVDLWSDNGAIPEANREHIRALYRAASPGFQKHHEVRLAGDGRIVDRMLFTIAVGIP